jgi:hypothetical protein
MGTFNEPLRVPSSGDLRKRNSCGYFASFINESDHGSSLTDECQKTVA